MAELGAEPREANSSGNRHGVHEVDGKRRSIRLTFVLNIVSEPPESLCALDCMMALQMLILLEGSRVWLLKNTNFRTS